MKGLLVIMSLAMIIMIMGKAQGQDTTSRYLERGQPRTVRYDLYVTDTVVRYTGKARHAIAINGTIPGPTLTFTEGDTAEVYVHNEMKTETSIHWHGLYVPNRYDGVPYLTQMPIAPGQVYLYKFPIRQSGTYWYHSHSGLQEQIGMYGALILHKRTKEPDWPTIPVVLSDWSDMKPEEIDRSLHNATDWFAIKKKTVQSYGEALQAGSFRTKVVNEWKRMNAMDVSDVYYERFLANGKVSGEEPQYKPGQRVRLRVINGSSSTYFWLNYGGGKITVIASDGNDVQPVAVDRLIVGISETYDVIVTVPDSGSAEFRASAEDRTGFASLWLGEGKKLAAPALGKLKVFAGMKMMNGMMKMNGSMNDMGMEMGNQVMDMNTVMYPESGMVTLNYGMLRAPEKTTLPDGPTKELRFELTGNMNRYVWSIDNKTVSESDRILIKKGERVKIVLYNNTMMRHPMHLHGHDFRVLNGQGEYAPLKNVLDIMPMETDSIEFAASESGDWFFHCHILYHMMSGMGRIFSYQDSPPNPDLPDPMHAMHMLNMDDRMAHLMVKAGVESNGTEGEATLAQTRWALTTTWHLGYNAHHGYESETMLGRYFGRMQWLFPYIGFDYHYKREGGPKNIFGDETYTWLGQRSDKLDRKTVIAGVAYTLPMLVVADARVDGKGKFRFQLSREDLPVTARLRLNWMLNTDKEYAAGLRYIVTKYFSVSTHYDSDMGYGAGITVTY